MNGTNLLFSPGSFYVYLIMVFSVIHTPYSAAMGIDNAIDFPSHRFGQRRLRKIVL